MGTTSAVSVNLNGLKRLEYGVARRQQHQSHHGASLEPPPDIPRLQQRLQQPGRIPGPLHFLERKKRRGRQPPTTRSCCCTTSSATVQEP